jgi:hypothetical protein
MSAFENLITRGLQAFESECPATIKIGPNVFAGTFSDLSVEDSAAFGGIESNVTGVFILRKALHPTRPTDRMAVKINGEQRKISGVVDDVGAWNLGIE